MFRYFPIQFIIYFKMHYVLNLHLCIDANKKAYLIGYFSISSKVYAGTEFIVECSLLCILLHMFSIMRNSKPIATQFQIVPVAQ